METCLEYEQSRLTQWHLPWIKPQTLLSRQHNTTDLNHSHLPMTNSMLQIPLTCIFHTRISSMNTNIDMNSRYKKGSDISIYDLYLTKKTWSGWPKKQLGQAQPSECYSTWAEWTNKTEKCIVEVKIYGASFFQTQALEQLQWKALNHARWIVSTRLRWHLITPLGSCICYIAYLFQNIHLAISL